MRECSPRGRENSLVVEKRQNGERGNCHHRRYARKMLFIATVHTHLANFHIPFMKMIHEWGYDVHAAASSAEGRRDDVEAAGVTCWEIPFARSPYKPANLQAFRRLKALLKSQRYDLIHVHTTMAAFLGRYLAKRNNPRPVYQ